MNRVQARVHTIVGDNANDGPNAQAMLGQERGQLLHDVHSPVLPPFALSAVAAPVCPALDVELPFHAISIWQDDTECSIAEQKWQIVLYSDTGQDGPRMFDIRFRQNFGSERQRPCRCIWCACKTVQLLGPPRGRSVSCARQHRCRRFMLRVEHRSATDGRRRNGRRKVWRIVPVRRGMMAEVIMHARPSAHCIQASITMHGAAARQRHLRVLHVASRSTSMVAPKCALRCLQN